MHLHRAIIIDDEHWARIAVEDKLAETGLFEMMGSFDSVADAHKFLRTQSRSLDFIFCDIEMPEVTGLEAAKLLKPHAHYFVCCTGHEKYTLEAWRHLVDGFLVKPIVDDLLLALVDKYRAMNRNMIKPQVKYLVMDAMPQLESQSAGKRFRSLVKVMIDEIRYFGKSGNYLYAYGPNKNGVLVKIARTASTVQDFMKKYWYLDNLIRINQSVIVNVDYVSHYVHPQLSIDNEIHVVNDLGKELLTTFFAKHNPNH